VSGGRGQGHEPLWDEVLVLKGLDVWLGFHGSHPTSYHLDAETVSCRRTCRSELGSSRAMPSLPRQEHGIERGQPGEPRGAARR
jgi:hypothetical protein